MQDSKGLQRGDMRRHLHSGAKQAQEDTRLHEEPQQEAAQGGESEKHREESHHGHEDEVLVEKKKEVICSPSKPWPGVQ